VFSFDEIKRLMTMETLSSFHIRDPSWSQVTMSGEAAMGIILIVNLGQRGCFVSWKIVCPHRPANFPTHQLGGIGHHLFMGRKKATRKLSSISSRECGKVFLSHQSLHQHEIAYQPFNPDTYHKNSIFRCKGSLGRGEKALDLLFAMESLSVHHMAIHTTNMHWPVGVLVLAVCGEISVAVGWQTLKLN
jgi:hypothetical protein